MRIHDDLSPIYSLWEWQAKWHIMYLELKKKKKREKKKKRKKRGTRIKGELNHVELNIWKMAR